MSLLLLMALSTLSVDSRIDSVIAYPDQAMVIRKASVTISGAEQLAFPSLPGILDDNSVRIRASGLKIGEVQTKPGYIAEPTGKVKTLEDSLEGLNELDKAFSDEQDMLKAKETFLVPSSSGRLR